MRVLLLSQHFAPEVTAGRFRAEAFVNGLSARGHQVTVICPVPNHPSGVVEPGYRGRPIRRRRVGSATVRYVTVFTRPKKGFRTRLAYYGSYLLMAILVGILLRRHDIVIASSPPLSVGLAGAVVARRHRARWIFDVRDVWPAVAVTLGELRSERIIRMSERLERALYRDADLTVSVTEAARRHIEARAAGSPVTVIPNGTTRMWLDAGRRDASRRAAGFPEERFVWVYAGNLGLAHGLDTAVRAAGLLGEEYRLVIVGEGPTRESLVAQAADIAGSSVEFRGLMPPDQVAQVLRAADALLVSWRTEGVMSAKLYDFCALGRPLVAAVPEDARREISDREIGLAASIDSPEDLAEQVRRLRHSSDLQARLMKNARSFAADHLREDQSRRLAELAEALVDGSSG